MDTHPSPSSMETFTHPCTSSFTTSSSPSGTRPKMLLSVEASLRTRRVSVLTVASLVPTSFASCCASSPTTTYSFFTYPSLIEPEEILYQPSTSSKT